MNRSPFASVVACALAPLALFACNFGLVQSPDRADDQGVEGPPPPADFHCERGNREVRDTDRDGHADQVVYLLTTGATVCSTEDRNHDGKIDRWNRVEDEKVVEQATDTDYDGKLDQRGVDTNRDGTMDAFTPFTLSPVVTPVVKPLDPAPSRDAG